MFDVALGGTTYKEERSSWSALSVLVVTFDPAKILYDSSVSKYAPFIPFGSMFS